MLFYTQEGNLLCAIKNINGRIKLLDASEGNLYLNEYRNYNDGDYYAIYFDEPNDQAYVIDSRTLDKYNFLKDDFIKIFPIDGIENTHPFDMIREALEYVPIMGIYYCLYKHNEFSSIN